MSPRSLTSKMNIDGMERTLGRIEATQELILKQLESHNKRLESHIEDDNKLMNRVSTMEHTMSKMYGVLIAVVTFFSFSSDIILKYFGLK